MDADEEEGEANRWRAEGEVTRPGRFDWHNMGGVGIWSAMIVIRAVRLERHDEHEHSHTHGYTTSSTIERFLLHDTTTFDVDEM
jgi:hypothetical protein